MNMYKSLALFFLSISSLIQIQCSSATVDSQKKMTLSQPSFATSEAHFNTYVAGVQGGGQGIEFYVEIDQLPTEIELIDVYFRESKGKLMRGTGNYVARFRTDTGTERDVVMSSDPNEEAVNTPPTKTEVFPFPLSQDEAGVSYLEKGVLKYAKILKVKETKGVAYPSAPPRDGGR